MFSNFLKYDTANSIQYQDGFFRIIRFIFLKAILQILHLLSIILKIFLMPDLTLNIFSVLFHLNSETQSIRLKADIYILYIIYICILYVIVNIIKNDINVLILFFMPNSTFEFIFKIIFLPVDT